MEQRHENFDVGYSALHSMSQELRLLLDLTPETGLTVENALAKLSFRSHALLILVLSFPFLLPIPTIGLSTVLGLVILVSGLVLGLGVPPWLPRWLRATVIPRVLLERVATRLISYFGRLEHLVRPRYDFIAQHPWALRLNGAIVCILALILVLPLPPGGNIPPALALTILALGLLEGDGLYIVAGYVLAAGNVAGLVWLVWCSSNLLDQVLG